MGKIATDFLHVAQQMVNGEPPIDMIAYLAEPGSAIQSAPSSELGLYNMASGLRFLNIVSESFRNPESQDSLMPWYTAREIRENLNDPEVVGAVLAKAGLDPAQMMAIAADQQVKDELKTITQLAVDRGVFGAPTFFVGDQMFWGQDRLDFVHEALSS